MLRPATASLLIAAMLTLSAQGSAYAQSARYSVKVRVESVLATDTHKGMDPKLDSGPIGRSLKSIFDYSTYRVLKWDELATICGRAVAFNLPGGRILHVAPMALEGDMIMMELVLFEGAHSIMRTQLKLMNHGTLILVGPRDLHETYITAITTETSGHRLPDEADLPPPPPAMNGEPAPADLPSTSLPVLP
jgi:hypothetical protein